MAKTKTKKELAADQRDKLLGKLQARFEKNMALHADMEWATVVGRLESQPDKLWSLQEMESSGGEPDVIGQDADTGEVIFCDCAKESPKGRRSLCYDRAALEERKEHKPKDSAVGMAETMGITLLTEAEYRALQKLGEFDLKTSSWLMTPPEIRERGGSIFGDRRYNAVFVYHNGAQSYYASRGFRGTLRV